MTTSNGELISYFRCYDTCDNFKQFVFTSLLYIN